MSKTGIRKLGSNNSNTNYRRTEDDNQTGGLQVERDKAGPYTYENGIVYTGEWLDGMKDGYGEQIWPDGTRYEGEWRMDKANG